MPVASRRQLFSGAHHVALLLRAVRGMCRHRLQLSVFRQRSAPFLAMVSLVTDVGCASGCDRTAPRLGTTAALRRSLSQWLSATGRTLGLVCAHVALPSIVPIVRVRVVKRLLRVLALLQSLVDVVSTRQRVANLGGEIAFQLPRVQQFAG